MKSTKFLLLIFILPLIVSCKMEINEENNQKDTYAIITLLYKKIAKPIEPIFPPTLNGKKFNKEDSIRIKKMILQREKEIIEGKFIVAFVPEFQTEYFDFDTLPCEINGEFLLFLKNRNQKETLKLSNIGPKKNDSLIYFKKELLDPYSKDFFAFDFLISLSPVVFNKENNEAIVVFSGARSKVDGVSTFYFLKKTNGTWKIICSEGLSIS